MKKILSIKSEEVDAEILSWGMKLSKEKSLKDRVRDCILKKQAEAQKADDPTLLPTMADLVAATKGSINSIARILKGLKVKKHGSSPRTRYFMVEEE